MLFENVLLDVTIAIIDNGTEEKAGQLRYVVKDREVEIFDTYIFPEYRRRKIMSSLLRKIISELKVSGVSKVRLKYFDEDARIAWERMGFRQIDGNNHMELHL